MAQPAPKFTVSYNNVGKKLPNEYKQFIDGVRARPQLSVRKVQNCNVLPKEKNPIEYFHVKLEVDKATDNNSLELKIQFHDLYLVAFKTRANKWFCFKDRPLPGAESVGVNANYNNLENTIIGWEQLTDAIQYLESYTKGKAHAEKHAQVLMVMICEGIRFDKFPLQLKETPDQPNKISHISIADLLHKFKNSWHLHPNQIQLGSLCADQITNWGNISEAMLKYHAQTGKKDPFPSSFTSFGIKTFEDATNTLSMLKFIE